MIQLRLRHGAQTPPRPPAPSGGQADDAHRTRDGEREGGRLRNRNEKKCAFEFVGVSERGGVQRIELVTYRVVERVVEADVDAVSCIAEPQQVVA